MIFNNDVFDFSKLAQDLSQPGALSLDQFVSDPSANPDVQSEINYLGRDAQSEIAHQNDLNQTDWSGLPQNQAVQNEVDFYASQSGWSVF